MSMLPAVSLRRCRSCSDSGDLLGLGRILHPRGCVLGSPIQRRALAPSRPLFRNGPNSSIGNGKMMVEFLSEATSARAWR